MSLKHRLPELEASIDPAASTRQHCVQPPTNIRICF